MPAVGETIVWNGVAWVPALLVPGPRGPGGGCGPAGPVGPAGGGGGGPPTGPAGGDLSGTYPNPTVDGLQTVPIAATAPTLGDVLTFDGATWTPAPGAAAFAGCAMVEPGINRTAVVHALILAGEKHLCFGEGLYLFESPLFATLTPAQKSGVQLSGAYNDRTVFTASYAGVGPDDAANTLVDLRGAITGAIATTVLAGVGAESGAYAFSVTSGVGIIPGMDLAIEGHNVPGLPNDALEMSDGAAVVLSEHIAVASIAAGVIQVDKPIVQWHSPGSTVRSVDVVRDVIIEGIYFNCSGGSIATAITSDYSRGVEIRDCSFEGFSRTAINLRLGARDFKEKRLHSHGEINGFLFFENAMVGEVEDITCDEDGLRFHTNGIARHLIKCFMGTDTSSRSTAIQFDNIYLQHACAGISWWGGWHLDFGAVVIRDMDPARIRATDIVGYPAGVVCGIGLDGGIAPLGFEAFALAVTFDHIEIHDCFGGVDDWAVHLHDTIYPHISQLSIYNHGPAWGTVIGGKTYMPQGFRTNDAIQGVIESLLVSGCTYAFVTSGSPTLRFGVIKLASPAGDGAATIPFYFDHTGPAAGIKADVIEVDNFNSAAFYFGPTFPVTPDYPLHFDRLLINGREYVKARLAINSTGVPMTVGNQALWDPASAAGTLGVIFPTDARADCVLVEGLPSATGLGFLIAAEFPQEGNSELNTSAAAIAIGDQLVSSPAGVCLSVPTPVANAIGTAVTAKAGGAPGVVRVAPPRLPEPTIDYFDAVTVNSNTVSAVPVVLLSRVIQVPSPRDVFFDLAWSLTLLGGTFVSVGIYIDGVLAVGSGGGTGGVVILSGSARWINDPALVQLAAGAHTITVQWFVNGGVGQAFCRPTGGDKTFESCSLTIREKTP